MTRHAALRKRLLGGPCPTGATTNSDSGVTDLNKPLAALKVRFGWVGTVGVVFGGARPGAWPQPVPP